MFIVHCPLFSQRSAFRALSLGEETAQSLGVDVARLRLTVILGVALGVGGAVAVKGTIGFIGLVAPHLMRPLIGHDPARLLLPSALAGAALLLATIDLGHASILLPHAPPRVFPLDSAL